jgi:hypothetical protein
MTNREHLYPDQSDVYPATDAEVIRFEVEDKAIATIRLLCSEGVWMQSVSVAFRFGDHSFQVGALTKKSSFPDRLAALSFALGVCLDHFKSEQEWKAVPEPPSVPQQKVSGQMYAKLLGYRDNNYSEPLDVPDPVQFGLFGSPPKIASGRAEVLSYGDAGREQQHRKRKR